MEKRREWLKFRAGSHLVGIPHLLLRLRSPPFFFFFYKEKKIYIYTYIISSVRL